jgi:hypothetical protein
MRRRTGLTLVTLIAGAVAVLAVGSYATADSGKKNLKSGELTGYEENPDISTSATGTFEISIDDDAREFTYELTYSGLEGAVQQAHIHFAKPAVNGGITLFLCSNLGNGPAGTPACPATATATVTRTVGAAAILSPAVGTTNQGIAAGAAGWTELVAALRAGHTYANVHSALWPAGEIRAQIND